MNGFWKGRTRNMSLCQLATHPNFDALSPTVCLFSLGSCSDSYYAPANFFLWRSSWESCRRKHHKRRAQSLRAAPTSSNAGSSAIISLNRALHHLTPPQASSSSMEPRIERLAGTNPSASKNAQPHIESIVSIMAVKLQGRENHPNSTRRRP